MRKYMVRDLSNYKGQYWGTEPGSMVQSPSIARKFTVEELVKHRSLAAAIRNNTAAIVEVNCDKLHSLPGFGY
jgi:hypothetical protein